MGQEIARVWAFLASPVGIVLLIGVVAVASQFFVYRQGYADGARETYEYVAPMEERCRVHTLESSTVDAPMPVDCLYFRILLDRHIYLEASPYQEAGE